MVGALACTASLGFCGASFHRLRWHWWALFLISALGSLYLFAGHTAGLQFTSGALPPPSAPGAIMQPTSTANWSALCFLLLVFAITRDFRQGQRGDGVHWTGISAWIVILMPQLALYIQFLPMPLSQFLRLLFTL